MFLSSLQVRNPALIRAAVDLHQRGVIPPNSFVLDVDAMVANAQKLAAESRRLNLKIFAMTKQFGRNPVATQAVVDAGVDGVVAVDVACALPLAGRNIRLSHIGHLVQVPRHEALVVARLTPDYWTVFSSIKAQEAAKAASAVGREQALLARVFGDGDQFYWGHEGGFSTSELARIAREIDALPGARLAGVTTFPALLFDAAAGRPMPTHNLRTVRAAADALGRTGLEVNAPGTTSVAALETLAEAGATQVEPGHALTGTTPWHAVADLPETPAMLYVTEISHFHLDRAFAFGGGLYIDPVFPAYPVKALVGAGPDELRRVDAEIPDPAAIDYYAKLSAGHAGDSVIFGFRAQAFVTRAFVVPLTGVATGQPQVHGVWTGQGTPALWSGSLLESSF
jgi:predicted amino acid racemase